MSAKHRFLGILAVLMVGLVLAPLVVTAQTDDPPGALSSATLFLRAEYTSHRGTPVHVHRVTADWEEFDVTWNSFAAAYDPAVEDSFASVTGQRIADVTALVQGWMDGTYPNYGLLLEQAPVYGTTFHSRETLIPDYVPFLRLCYLDGTCDRIYVEADTYVWERKPDENYGDRPVFYTGLFGRGEKRSLLWFNVETEEEPQTPQ